ncbi:uncharacterized protein LOC113312823 [Papaver somniferum]|uniref:uncharacterized protein LOC113312823 n=1 Tax=Papaver somniferum TaxID=3469 RepID=UPI000E7041CB|nr:uncharacterized protein LOC113312823 [Papaver somniferum]
MFNTLEDLRILNYFKVSHRSCKNSTPIEIYWSPPEVGEIIICCDGASLGNPGQVGAGVCFRDSNVVVLGSLCIGLGWRTKFYVEVCVIIYGLMLDKRWNITKICIRSDSMSFIKSLQKGELSWELAQRWRMTRAFYSSIRYIHSYRDANFTDDALDKQACLLVEDIFEFYEGMPAFIQAIEWPDKVYYRFK